jgi:hypothetical protein
MPTRRQQEMRRVLGVLAPRLPLADATDVLARAGSGTLKDLSASAAVWLALTSHVRHRYTDYDTLLADGYDRDSARFFVAGAMQDALTGFGCTRAIGEDEAAER